MFALLCDFRPFLILSRSKTFEWKDPESLSSGLLVFRLVCSSFSMFPVGQILLSINARMCRHCALTRPKTPST